MLKCMGGAKDDMFWKSPGLTKLKNEWIDKITAQHGIVLYMFLYFGFFSEMTLGHGPKNGIYFCSAWHISSDIGLCHLKLAPFSELTLDGPKNSRITVKNKNLLIKWFNLVLKWFSKCLSSIPRLKTTQYGRFLPIFQ